MPVSPNRPLTAKPRVATKSRAAEAPFELDLGLGARPLTPAPRLAAPVPANTNVARINGQNVRYMGPEGKWGVEMPYLQADLIDLTPQNPLTIWEFGSYKIRVKTGQVRMTEAQANQAIAANVQSAGLPVTGAGVEFRDNNTVKLKGTYHWHGVPVPLSVTARLETPTRTTVSADLNSVRVFGLPVLWAMKLFGADFSKQLGTSGLATWNKDQSVALDLTKAPNFEGTVSKIAIGAGKALVTLGDAPAPSLQGPRTGGNPNYTEIVAVGEVALESATIRNATVVTVDSTPEDPYSFNMWDVEGFAHVESGDVILDEQKLAKKFASAGSGFFLKQAKLQGADLVVEGQKEVFGLPFPISFKINFAKTADGRLKLTPHDVSVLGLGFGQGQLEDAMAEVPGLKKEGDGFILDLRASASVEMPPIRQVATEPGRIVLRP